MIGEYFDPAFDAIMANCSRLSYAVFAGGVLIGITAWLNPSPADRTVEIGATYIAPAARGTGVNLHMKRLMIDHAIALGYERIEFRIDVRNTRSMAAVEKLGARLEGVIRRHRTTWTGHRRSSALYSLLPEEWAEEWAAR
jgi:RimJ/RimL family protein N-acetyltransferase